MYAEAVPHRTRPKSQNAPGTTGSSRITRITAIQVERLSRLCTSDWHRCRKRQVCGINRPSCSRRALTRVNGSVGETQSEKLSFLITAVLHVKSTWLPQPATFKRCPARLRFFSFKDTCPVRTKQYVNACCRPYYQFSRSTGFKYTWQSLPMYHCHSHSHSHRLLPV